MLHVQAEPGVSITVFDSDLRPVTRGLGVLHERLPLGLYDVQLLAGHGLSHHVVRVGMNGATFTAPATDFPSPAPLSRNAADDVVAKEAARLSRSPQERLGHGSQLLVVVRDDAKRAGGNAATGLSLRSLNGAKLASLDQLVTRSAEGEHPVWAVVCLELDPGPYLLRSATGRGTLEQVAIAVSGWQTQVFLDRKNWLPGGGRRRASLPDASVLMARVETGFDPSRHDLRLTELARIALLDRQSILSPGEIRELLWGKWANPMLGLYGANVVLATGVSHVGQLDVVRRNLRWLLGDNPDVSALDVRAGETVSPLRAPPMLRASWDALVAATAEQPELIASDSVPGKIANHLFGTGVWLTWEATRARSAKPTQRVQDTSIAGGIDELADLLVAEQSASKRKKRRKQAAPLSPVSESVVAIATERAREKNSGLAPTKPFSERDLVEMLGAPKEVVVMALSEAFDTLA
jgi:hypothetical protein